MISRQAATAPMVVTPRSEAELRTAGGLKWSATPIGSIGAWVAETDFPLAPVIGDALRQAIDDGLTGYLPDDLAGRAEAACARWQRRYGWNVEPDQVHLVPDVTSALQITAQQLCPGVPIVLPVPAYMPFLDLPGLIGRELITVDLRNVDGRYEFDLAALASALAGGGLLVLTNPHNPTGRVFGADELLAVADVVQAAGATVFSDEIHAPLVYPGAVHLPYAGLSEVTAGHTVTATSASKGWNVPGLLCAQVLITSDRLNDAWRAMNPLVTHGVSPLGAVAARVAYTDGEPYLQAILGYLDTGRTVFADALTTALPSAGFRPPDGTYLGWIDLRDTGLDPARVSELAKVLGFDGALCGAPGFLRLNLAMSHQLLAQAARRLGLAAAGISIEGHAR